MIFEHLPAGPLQVNCFILGDEKSGNSVVIDPGGNVDRISSIMKKNGLTEPEIVMTHGHWDHTGGADELKKKMGGRILIHERESTKGFQADAHPVEGDVISFGPHQLKVFDTPGHSPGGISLYWAERKVVFVGDLLFAGSIGRTDLAGGSFETLIRSVVTKIFPLGNDVEVMTGHGPMTTVGREKKYNPFLKGVAI